MIHLGVRCFAQVFFLLPHFYPLMGENILKNSLLGLRRPGLLFQFALNLPLFDLGPAPALPGTQSPVYTWGEAHRLDSA